jgi:hypothetical protein
LTLGAVFLWLSIAVTIIGVVLSIRLAALARGGALFPFTVLLTLAITVFGFHHVAELLLVTARGAVISESLEAVSSLIFLIAAVYLGYRLRRALYGK